MHPVNELQESVGGNGRRNHHCRHDYRVADVSELPLVSRERIGGKRREVHGEDRVADGNDEGILKTQEQILICVPEDFPVAGEFLIRVIYKFSEWCRISNEGILVRFPEINENRVQA